MACEQPTREGRAPPCELILDSDAQRRLHGRIRNVPERRLSVWAFVAKLISDKQLGSIPQRVLRLLPRRFPSNRTLNWAIFPSAQRIILCAALARLVCVHAFPRHAQVGLLALRTEPTSIVIA